MTSSAKADIDRQCLAARFVEGPRLFAPDHARLRLESWLADLSAEHAAAIQHLIERFAQLLPFDRH